VIVRPDGMDTLWPDELAGDFVGFPRSVTADQPLSRYVNREAPESASQVRMYSFLIDPTITLETGGHRIDALLSRYAGQVRSPKVSRLLSVWRSPDSSTLLIRKNYLADRPEDRLTLELTLSLDRGCLPQSARMFREVDGTVVEATVWEYSTSRRSSWKKGIASSTASPNGSTGCRTASWSRCRPLPIESRPSFGSFERPIASKTKRRGVRRAGVRATHPEASHVHTIVRPRLRAPRGIHHGSRLVHLPAGGR